MFDTNITTREKNKRHPQSVVNLKFKNFCPLCFCLTKTFFLWPNKVTIFVPKSSNLFSPRKTVGTMYIRLQAYVYIYQCIYIYIYTLAESRYALSYTLVTQTMLALPPTGVSSPSFFNFFKNQKLKSFRISRPSRKTCCKNDGDFTRTEKT